MRNNSHAFVNQLLLFLLVTVCGGGSVGVGLVWLRHQNSVIANRNRVLAAQIREVERHIIEAKTQVETAQSPEALRQLNRRFGLGLAPVTDGQFVHVAGDPVQRLMARATRELLSEGPAALPAITLTR
jgi:hypothetical protein